MRFMVMHKHDKHTEAGELPPPELIQRMGALIGKYAQSGRFLDGNGLLTRQGRHQRHHGSSFRHGRFLDHGSGARHLTSPTRRTQAA